MFLTLITLGEFVDMIKPYSEQQLLPNFRCFYNEIGTIDRSFPALLPKVMKLFIRD